MLTIKPYQENFSFKANLNSPRLRLNQKDFFIKIRGYGRNSDWAKQIVKTTDVAVNMIRNNSSAENVLKLITRGVCAANRYPYDIEKRVKTGILRTHRENWSSVHTKNREVYTPYKKGRYNCYSERLDNVCNSPLLPISNEIGMSRPNNKQEIQHGKSQLINKSLDYIFSLFKNKFSVFIDKDVKNTDLTEIINIVAEIRWVLAHATPWLRGSDAISNVFMRAMLKAVGVKAYPPAKNISYDLEAYCRNIDDYKKNFNSFFEKPLEVIE